MALKNKYGVIVRRSDEPDFEVIYIAGDDPDDAERLLANLDLAENETAKVTSLIDAHELTDVEVDQIWERAANQELSDEDARKLFAAITRDPVPSMTELAEEFGTDYQTMASWCFQLGAIAPRPRSRR